MVLLIEIDVINVANEGKIPLNKALKNIIAKIPVNENERLFFRTSSWKGAQYDIQRSLVDIAKSEYLLELGAGAYITPDLEYCLYWMEKLEGGAASLIAYRVPKNILSGMEGRVIDNEDDWRVSITSMLKQRKYPFGPGYIFTFCCGNPQKVCSCSRPYILKLEGKMMRQLLLKEKEAFQFSRVAEIFLINIESIKK